MCKVVLSAGDGWSKNNTVWLPFFRTRKVFYYYAPRYSSLYVRPPRITDYRRGVPTESHGTIDRCTRTATRPECWFSFVLYPKYHVPVPYRLGNSRHGPTRCSTLTPVNTPRERSWAIFNYNYWIPFIGKSSFTFR